MDNCDGKDESEPPLPDEKTVIFLGEKKSGKSSLATLISSEREKEELKPTAALDFKFERNTPAPNKKEISNLFELGGGRLLANLVAAPINKDTVLSAVAVIVLDLTTPGLVLDSLQFWLNVVREYVDKAVAEAYKENPKAVERLQERVRETWHGH